MSKKVLTPAQKAIRTMRANKRKRSQAALKAWKTRRAAA